MLSHMSLEALNILCLCITVHCVDEKEMFQVEPRIVGGAPVPIETFPHAVQIFNFGSLCGGSVLSSWAVLTAAHCFNYNSNVKEIQVIVGAKYIYDMSAKKYEVWQLVLHEDFNKETYFACDIALIFTNRPIKLSKKVQKAILVTSDIWMNEEETNFTATGWGYLSYGGSVSNLGLMETHLRFIPSKKCSLQHSGLLVTTDMFCLYGEGERDTCQGDSGGAILWHGMVVGLVSHGHRCAEKDRPGIYTNVYHFRKWIEKKMIEAREKYCILPPK